MGYKLPVVDGWIDLTCVVVAAEMPDKDHKPTTSQDTQNWYVQFGEQCYKFTFLLTEAFSEIKNGMEYAFRAKADTEGNLWSQANSIGVDLPLPVSP